MQMYYLYINSQIAFLYTRMFNNFQNKDKNVVHLIIFVVKRYHASINSKREHPPPWQTPGESFGVVKSPALGQNFSAKARPPGQKNTYPGHYFRRSSQPFLLIGVEILGFYSKQTLKRIGRLSNYSLVIPSSFSLSTILKVLKFPPSFETDFVTRERQ